MESLGQTSEEDERILSAMQDSGIINEMADKLKSGAPADNEIPDKKSPLSSDERSMLVSFIEEYRVDKKKQVTQKVTEAKEL